MDGRVYMNYVHSSTMLKQLTALWKNDFLCDAVLTVDNCIMARAHKIVLLAVSPKLQSDSSSLSQTSFMDVQLPSNVTSQSVEAFLRYIYEGFLYLTKDNLEDLHKIAVQLEMPSLYKFCKDFSVKTGMSSHHNKWNKNTDSWVNYISDFSLDDFAQVRIMHDANKVMKKSNARSEVKECDSSKGQRVKPKQIDIIDLCETSSDKTMFRSNVMSTDHYAAENARDIASSVYKHNQAFSQVQRQENTSLPFKQTPIHKKQHETETPQTRKPPFSDGSQSQTYCTDDMQHSRGGSYTNIDNENITTSSENPTSKETHIFDTQSGRSFTLPNTSSESDKNFEPTSDFSNLSSSSLLRKVLTEMPVSKMKKNPIVSSNVLSEILQADSAAPSYNSGSQHRTDYTRHPYNTSRANQSRTSFRDEHTATSHPLTEHSNDMARGIQRSEGRTPVNTDKTACVSASSLLRAIVESQYYGHENSGRSTDKAYSYSSKESSPGLVRIQKEPAEEPSSSDQSIAPIHIKKEPVDGCYGQCSSSGGLQFEVNQNPVDTSEEHENLMGFYLSHVKKEPREYEQDPVEENSASDIDLPAGESSDDPEWHPSKKRRKKMKASKSSYPF